MKRGAIIVHDIRSTHNVGSIFRTADCAGVCHIYLSGFSPTPLDRFMRPRKDIAKVALGAENSISWTYEHDVIALLHALKKEGKKIIALEQSERSVDYRTVVFDEHVVLILGNEVDGVSQEILTLCDVIAEIPLFGSKESLNVSVAAGIALFGMK